MNQISAVAWENRLTRVGLIFLVIAAAFGVFAGAVVTMYYDITSNMGALEDNLATPLGVFYLLAILVSFVHLPLALLDIRQRHWRQAFIRAGAFIGPSIVFIGADGLIAHLLWWSPISETDRYHMLHHSLFAGVPLTLIYGLALRWLWRPADFKPAPPLSRLAWLLVSAGTAFVVVALMAFFGLMMGLVSLPIP